MVVSNTENQADIVPVPTTTPTTSTTPTTITPTAEISPTNITINNIKPLSKKIAPNASRLQNDNINSKIQHPTQNSTILSTSANNNKNTRKIGKIGVCAMDKKVLSKPCRHILNCLNQNDEFELIIFGDKVILDESIENWPTCDFLISFFSNGFPLNKAINYVKLRKPFILNDLVMQKVLWDRRLCLRLLKKVGIPTPHRLEISRDGGPKIIDADLKQKLLEKNIDIDQKFKTPNWEMLDQDTLKVDDQILKKPFVEKPVDGEDHNIFIYYSSKNGGGGRRLFRKIGNKSSEFDPSLSVIRTNGSYIYEQFMDTDNFEDVKAYTVGENYCHAETRKSPVVDGIVRRNTHGKEIRFVTTLSDQEKEIASKVSSVFHQTICGFDLLRVQGVSYVIDVNGFSFVKGNSDYYNNCAQILKNIFFQARIKRDLQRSLTGTPYLSPQTEEKHQKWVFKGLVSVIRHGDRTPKQKIKYSFKSSIFIALLKGHKEEVIIRAVPDLRIVLAALHLAQQQKYEDSMKLQLLATTLAKKINFPGTKIQLKPILNKESNQVEKVQFILKWGGEPTHSARYQATDLGETFRQDIKLLNKDALKNVRVYSSSERRVVTSAQIWACSFLEADMLPDDFLRIRKDLLDDSNAAKDLMDKVKKKLKPLLRQGKEPPKQFAWPARMPEPYIVIRRVVELMNYHHKIMEYHFKNNDVESMQRRWCCSEDPYLFKERWDKLFKEFLTFEKVDPSKISELYDTMKYDALHNRSFLQKIFSPNVDLNHSDVEMQFLVDDLNSPSLVNEYPINVLAMNNFKLPISSKNSTNNETATKEKELENSSSVGSLGWVLRSANRKTSRTITSSPFDDPKYSRLRELYKLAKVLFDFVCPQEYGIEDNEKLDIGLLTSLPLARRIVQDISMMRETDKSEIVTYFTKESHIYTLLNIIYESKLPMRIARNALPELDYLSQIGFELYESADTTSGVKRHSIRLSLSPGCHTQDPLDIQLDEKHYISNIPKISLTRHLDIDLVTQKLKSRFSRVSLPKKFTAVNITSPSVASLTENKVTL
ncbi:inositol polyphosphate kinase VIP1 ASCRUDRAFT_30386 [Ascoidea rubescens DSM 1968]|uniref:Inositol hexakisphosphate and diphosphoinositol-pentakisphosphate kinase n=1 Tax=Ascoidea rubescens DSM 1968 TaxID=1344418 RepID=A0A1D2VPD9_9ASCO|nr:hypothetical protein ASCRUDRAFT_30386 [Ascoidea rubescens DSM 1968]ODV63470.1 hypothetical protein ASCRUDRAFT_30386 [Ascoidea rubescens DSM 1968]